jgi:hypothetical protein
MSDIFSTLEDYVPSILWLFLWLAALPIRVLALLLLPVSSNHRWHKLHGVCNFFSFRKL